MGTLVLKNPHNVLAGFALSLVDSVIRIYASAVKSRNSERMVKNLNWLVSMRARLDARLALIGQTPDTGVGAAAGGEEEVGDDDDLELLGWKTRLVERAEAGLMRARTINPSPRDVISPSMRAASTAAAAAEAPGVPGDLLVSTHKGQGREEGEADASSTSSGTQSRDRMARSRLAILARLTGGPLGAWPIMGSNSGRGPMGHVSPCALQRGGGG